MNDVTQDYNVFGVWCAELQKKLEQVKETLAGYGRVIVAFSGGVDSTLLAKLARDVLGKEQTLAATAESASLAREDLEICRRLALALDLSHLVITTKEMQEPSYRKNEISRCYFCKRELFEELEDLARLRHIPVVLYGAIGDDQLADRPGYRAALEYGVHAPLQEAGLTKREVRVLAKSLGLPNWNRPQNACLSSRIPHGQEVTEEKLKRVEAAESMLRGRGFRQVRVRHMGAHARIEVGADEISRFQDSALRQAIERQFQSLGFQSVGIDCSGYRVGGANKSVVDEISLSAIAQC